MPPWWHFTPVLPLHDGFFPHFILVPMYFKSFFMNHNIGSMCFGLLLRSCQHPVTIFVGFREKKDVHYC
jgi:hypothetical protein